MTELKITAAEAEDIEGKLDVLAGDPELLADYGLDRSQAESLIAAIPRKGGVWEIPFWAGSVVSEELEDRATALRWIADDERAAGMDNQARATRRLAQRLEKLAGQVSA